MGILIALIACSPRVTPQLENLSQNLVTPSSTVSFHETLPPIITQTPTNAQVPTSVMVPTNTSLPTNIAIPKSDLLRNCLVLSSSSDKQVLTSNILLVSEGVFRDLFLLNPLSHQKTLISKIHTPFAISSDYQQLAYIDSNQQLTIYDVDKGVTLVKPVSRNWQGVIKWVNDQTLMIENMPMENGYNKLPASSLVFNLLNDVQQEFLPDFPYMEKLFGGIPRWGNYAFTAAVMDPTLTRVVYLSSGKVDDDAPLVLWDLMQNQEVLSLHGNDFDYGGAPQWFNDGSRFITGLIPVYTSWRGKTYKNVDYELPYKGGYEIASVSRDGDIQLLTFFTTQQKAGAEGLSLSPDEQKVAFWFNSNYESGNHSTKRELAILDLVSGSITSFCITSGVYPYPPVWSPDSNYLLLTISDRYISPDYIGTDRSDVILVNLVAGTYQKVEEQVVGGGWLGTKSP